MGQNQNVMTRRNKAMGPVSNSASLLCVVPVRQPWLLPPLTTWVLRAKLPWAGRLYSYLITSFPIQGLGTRYFYICGFAALCPIQLFGGGEGGFPTFKKRARLPEPLSCR